MTSAELMFFKEQKAISGTKIIKTGWPDFLIERKDDVWAVEIKAGFDRLSHAQKTCHDMLKKAGMKVDVIYYDGNDFNSIYPEKITQDVNDFLDSKLEWLFKLERKHKESLREIIEITKVKRFYESDRIKKLEQIEFYISDGI